MLWLTIASAILTAGALYYAWRQTNIANALKAHQEEQDREVYEWQLKHEGVAVQISRINPGFMAAVPNTSNSFTNVYGAVFSDPRLRQKIETYLVEATANRFTPRKPTPHELRSPALRETVKLATEAIEVCRKENPAFARLFDDRDVGP